MPMAPDEDNGFPPNMTEEQQEKAKTLAQKIGGTLKQAHELLKATGLTDEQLKTMGIQGLLNLLETLGLIKKNAPTTGGGEPQVVVVNDGGSNNTPPKVQSASIAPITIFTVAVMGGLTYMLFSD